MLSIFPNNIFPMALWKIWQAVLIPNGKWDHLNNPIGVFSVIISLNLLSISIWLEADFKSIFAKCFIFASSWLAVSIFGKVSVVLWLSSQDVDTTTRVQILDEPDYISHSTNTLGKGMNPKILPPAMDK